MLKVGLTGGLASGKSFVGHALADLGCLLIRSDDLGHEVLAPEGEVFAEVVREFGPQVLDAAGQIDRRALGSLVFADPARLDALNALVHPAVHRMQDSLMAEYFAGHPDGIAVVEAAILIETGSARRFHRIILAVCTERQQIERSMKRDGLPEAEVRARLSHQMPLEEKRKNADYVIDTSGEKEQTLAQTRLVYQALRSIQP